MGPIDLTRNPASVHRVGVLSAVPSMLVRRLVACLISIALFSSRRLSPHPTLSLFARSVSLIWGSLSAMEN